MREKRSVYRSKIDLPMMATKILGCGILLIAAYHLLRLLPPTEDAAGGLMLLILAGVGLVAAPVRYVITSTGLMVQYGLVKTHVPPGSILRVYPSRTLAAPTALALDQLAVEYRAGPHARPTLHISPARRDEFLHELAAVYDLEMRDRQWVCRAPSHPQETLRG